VGPPKRERTYIHVHHHIPRTRPCAKRKKERVDKRGVLIMHAPFIENFDQFFSPPFTFLRRGIDAYLPNRLVVRRSFLYNNIYTRVQFTPPRRRQSARRFIAIIYNRYTFIIIVRCRHTHCTTHAVHVHLYNNAYNTLKCIL